MGGLAKRNIEPQELAKRADVAGDVVDILQKDQGLDFLVILYRPFQQLGQVFLVYGRTIEHDQELVIALFQTLKNAFDAVGVGTRGRQTKRFNQRHQKVARLSERIGVHIHAEDLTDVWDGIMRLGDLHRQHALTATRGTGKYAKVLGGVTVVVDEIAGNAEHLALLFYARVKVACVSITQEGVFKKTGLQQLETIRHKSPPLILY